MQLPLRAARALTRHVVRPVLGTRLSPARQRQVIDALMRFPVLPSGTSVRSTSSK